MQSPGSNQSPSKEKKTRGGLEFGVYIIAVGKQDGFGSQEHKNLLTIHDLRNSSLQRIMLPRFLLGSYIVHGSIAQYCWQE